MSARVKLPYGSRRRPKLGWSTRKTVALLDWKPGECCGVFFGVPILLLVVAFLIGSGQCNRVLKELENPRTLIMSPPSLNQAE